MKKTDYNRVRQAFAELSLVVAYNPKLEKEMFVGLSLLSDVISDFKVRKMHKRAEKLKSVRK